MFNTYTDDNCCWTIILSLSVLPMKFCPLYAVWHMLPQWLQKPLKVSSMKLTSCPGSYHFVFPRKHILWCFVHFLKKNQKKKTKHDLRMWFEYLYFLLNNYITNSFSQYTYHCLKRAHCFTWLLQLFEAFFAATINRRCSIFFYTVFD